MRLPPSLRSPAARHGTKEAGGGPRPWWLPLPGLCSYLILHRYNFTSRALAAQFHLLAARHRDEALLIADSLASAAQFPLARCRAKRDHGDSRTSGRSRGG